MTLYLSSYEYPEFEIPREVLHYTKIKLDNNQCLAINVDVPIIGQKYGLFDEDISELFLISRVDKSAFTYLDKFPIDVYVLIVKDTTIKNVTSISDLKNIGWACLYDNIDDAKEHRAG